MPPISAGVRDGLIASAWMLIPTLAAGWFLQWILKRLIRRWVERLRPFSRPLLRHFLVLARRIEANPAYGAALMTADLARAFQSLLLAIAFWLITAGASLLRAPWPIKWAFVALAVYESGRVVVFPALRDSRLHMLLNASTLAADIEKELAKLDREA